MDNCTVQTHCPASFQSKYQVLVKWKILIAHFRGKTKKAPPGATGGWFMETRAHLVVNICGSLKRGMQLSYCKIF